MREIKFRFWNKKQKQMDYCSLEDLCEDDYWVDGETTVWGALYDSNYKQEKFIVMQYTGLKDKNGKEIYEGDIIYIKGETELLDIKGKVKYSDTFAKFLIVDTGDIVNEAEPLGDYEEFEVIGNVWEDSDLLNDSKNTKSN